MSTSTAIWPHDILKEPNVREKRENPAHLKCFMICPFEPKKIFDGLFELINEVCKQIGKSHLCQIECVRADKISSSGIIPAEIWREISTADFIIVDVTGTNGNVMIELGVAAACREKDSIIILKENDPKEGFLFDIGAARHIIYERTYPGFKKLGDQLARAITDCLTPAPYLEDSELEIKLPLSTDFSKGQDAPWLVGPSITHRRIISGYLEFGSLFTFRNSWQSIADQEFQNFELRAKMRFTQDLQDPKISSWIGISIRNHGVFADYGHLLYLTNKGEVRKTEPVNEFEKSGKDPLLGELDNFDLTKFYEFRIKIDNERLSMSVDTVESEHKLVDLSYVHTAGKILFQTYHARAGIKTIGLRE